MFNGGVFPTYLSGSLYLVKHSAVPCLYAQALKLPLFHIEDVFITGFVAQKCNLTRYASQGVLFMNIETN